MKPAKRHLTFAVSGLLVGCTLFPGERIEGCMYRRGRVVNVRCINEILANAADNPGTGFPIRDFNACAGREFALQATASSTLFIDESVRRSVKSACLFEGRNFRNYYRWEEDTGRLYVRYLSCAAGCLSISDVYDVEFSEGGIKATLLATYRE